MAVNPPQLTEIERAYRDGKIDARLDEHAAHLATINGSQENTRVLLERLTRLVEKQGDQLTGLMLTIPKLQTVAEQVAHAEQVDAALRQKRMDDLTFWDRNRAVVAWALGIVAVLTATSTQWLRVFGVG